VLGKLLVKWLVLAVAVAVASSIVPSVHVDGGALGVLWVAALLGLVNAVIGPVLRVLAFPLTVLTLGLFAIVVNAALLGIVAGLSSHLDIGGFWATCAAAVIVSLVSMALGLVLDDRRRHRSLV
jgi:putative membrane protein